MSIVRSCSETKEKKKSIVLLLLTHSNFFHSSVNKINIIDNHLFIYVMCHHITFFSAFHEVIIAIDVLSGSIGFVFYCKCHADLKIIKNQSFKFKMKILRLNFCLMNKRNG